MKRPPPEWMATYGVTERDLEVAAAWVNGAGNMHPDLVAELSLAALIATERAKATIPIALACPRCHQQHVDEGEWATKPHRTHLCVAGPFGPGCGAAWRPADVATVGVARPWNQTPEQQRDVEREVAEQTADEHRDDHPKTGGAP